MPHDDITKAIGRTPVIKLRRISDGVYVKLESSNPGGSIKDRAALYMIASAEARGDLKKGGTIVEPTSGNTGIGIAMIAAALGYRFTAVMPDNMSKERADIMAAYGANIIFTPGSEGMSGAVKEAERIASETGAFLPRQFDNRDNAMSHYVGTAKEILEDLPDVNAVVAGIGTGGTVSGIGKAMRDFSRDVKIIGVEPSSSPLITSGKTGPHKIQGIGANFIPGNLDMSYVDKIVTVSDEDAIKMTRRLAREEGILAGISSGAAVHAAKQIASGKGKVLAILPDGGERYMSTGIFGGMP